MRKYYTRPCNFYYGNQAKRLIRKKKAFSLAGNTSVAFDQIEVFKRLKKKKVNSSIYSIKNIPNNIWFVIRSDLKKIVSKRQSIIGLDFNKPKIMGVLNVTPDSFSDGGLFFKESKALNQASLLIKNGASIIDIGGESTRPGSKTINEKNEWNRIKQIIKKIKKKFPKTVLSLDTRKSGVMKKGLECGVDIINDVSGLNFDK